MFGEDIEIRQLKKRLSAAGADMDVVKEWQRILERIHKQYYGQFEKYEKSKSSLKEVDCIMKRIEQMMIAREDWSKEQAKELAELRKELKKMKDSYIHEFLVSKDDKDFHLTYETILKLMDHFDGKNDHTIILQSEVENILAIAAENLEKEKPNMLALTYFYIVGSDAQLTELPPKMRLEKITSKYEAEFINPMRNELRKIEDFSVEQLHALIFRICTE